MIQVLTPEEAIEYMTCVSGVLFHDRHETMFDLHGTGGLLVSGVPNGVHFAAFDEGALEEEMQLRGTPPKPAASERCQATLVMNAWNCTHAGCCSEYGHPRTCSLVVKVPEPPKFEDWCRQQAAAKAEPEIAVHAPAVIVPPAETNLIL